MPQPPEDTSASVKRSSRKSHRKSRNGCDDCKKRRIKCDEQKPACSNCTKHSTRCSFLRQLLPAHSSPAPSTQEEHLLPPISPPGTRTPSFTERRGESHALPISPGPTLNPTTAHPSLNVRDLELLHNYDTSTSYTLATIPALQIFLRLNVPRMAFSHPFLLHGILAISALHLAHFKKDLRAHYLDQAHYHYHVALPIVTTLLRTMNESTCSALYMFSTLCNMFTLGMGPKPGDFLVFGERGLAEWFVLFRGMRTIMEFHPGVLENSELSPLFSISIRQIDKPPSNNQHLQALRQLIVERTSDVADAQVFVMALEELSSSFPESFAPGSPSAQTSPQIVFVWLYRLSDEFVQCLQNRNPTALVILAHFCILLNNLGSFWWIKGWVEHLLSAIYESLDAEHRMWMNWPMEEIGWIPGS